MVKSPEALSLLLLDVIKHLIFEKDAECFWNGLDNDTREVLCREADEQRLGPLLYFYWHGKSLLDTSWEKKFSVVFRAWSAGELKRANELKHILSLQAENQIIAAPLKGVALAYTSYPHPALRPMCDFDILIKTEDADKAWKFMLENNFRSDNFKTPYHMPVLFSANGQALELHTHICHKTSFPEEFVWGEVYSTSLLGCKTAMLSPELNILHAIDHALHDNLVCGFKVFVDIAFIINKQHPDPEKLRGLAIKLGMESKLIFFMNIFPDFFPGEYLIESTDNIEVELEHARFLLLNAKRLQQVDKHFLMLSCDYLERKGVRKIFFILKKCMIPKKIIEYKYKRQMNFAVFIYYYYKEISKQFSKLMSFEKNITGNEFIQDAAGAQKNIQIYFAKSGKTTLSQDR